MKELAGTALVVALLLPWAAGPDVGDGKLQAEEPGAPARLLSVHPGLMPPGWRAHLPARDGDLLVATASPVPRSSVGVEDVRREIVKPMLAVLGCPDVKLVAPPDAVRSPRADASRLARAMRVPAGVGGSPATQSLVSVSADLERQLITYPFVQVLHDRAIAPGGLVVTGWEGQGPSAIRGSIVCFPRVANVPVLSPAETARRAVILLEARLLAKLVVPLETPRPVLRVMGVDAEGRTLLRHAHGLALAVERDDEVAVAHAWIDAEHGTLLALETLPGVVPSPSPPGPPGLVRARALVWTRDPGLGPGIAEFDIDEAGPGGYVLARAGVMERVRDRDGGPLVSGATPDFVRPPHDDWPGAICRAPDNQFHQLNVAATILRAYDVAAAQGLFSPMPWAWRPAVGGRTCAPADLGMKFEHCPGYGHPRCPDGHDAGVDDESGFHRDNLLSWAQDNTVVVHEAAHLLVPLATHLRRPDWCGRAPCPMPALWARRFHDLADFWGDHLEWTNCFGGWVGRNLRGPGGSRACTRHSESRWLPRRHDPPSDRFPEHRTLHGGGEYADGQIAAAALWGVRAGMLSLGGAAGVAQFGVRFQRALSLAGFVARTADGSHAGLYRIFHDLQAQLADQWATSLEGPGGPAAVNKVLAGFARTGVFLLPYQCLDGDASTTEPTVCPSRDHGGDAVIDVDDRRPGDDPRSEGVTHPETDYLARWGRPPRFHVWTGPRYWLDAGERGADPAAPPCNTRFLVEVSRNSAFPPDQTVTSGWRQATSCRGSWRPGLLQWLRLQFSGEGDRVYYRARTDAGWAGSERISTAPGAGLWTVPAPYAVLTADGRPTY